MAFFQDMRPAREPFLNAPATVLWLIGALLVAHVARVLAPPPWPDTILLHYAFIPARYSSAALANGLPASLFEQIATFVTYMFLHGNFTHVGINCLWLLAFGPIVARRLRPAKFLLFFLLCGVVAAATHLVVYWGAAEEVVGASGAISGLMAAGMRILYGRLYHKGEVQPGQAFPLAPISSGPIIGFTLIWAIVNIVGGISGLGLTDDATVVAWVAHLGGYLAGLFTIGLFDRSSLLDWTAKKRLT